MIIYHVMAGDSPGEVVTMASFFKEKEAQRYIDLLADAQGKTSEETGYWIEEQKLYHSAWEALKD